MEYSFVKIMQCDFVEMGSENMKKVCRWTLLSCFLLTSTKALAGPNELPAPGSHRPVFVDDAMVDILSRSTQFQIADLSIGSGIGKLSHVLMSEGSRISPSLIVDNFRGGLGLSVGQSSNGGGCPFVAGTPVESDCFVRSGTAYVPRKATSSTLLDLGNNQFLYTAAEGSQFFIDGNYSAGGSNASGGIIRKIIRPNGMVVNVVWDIVSKQTPYGAIPYLRILNVSNSAGYAIKYEYASDDVNNGDIISGWSTLKRITGFNRAIENCPETALHCNFINNWPSTSLTWSMTHQYVGYELEVANAQGETASYKTDPVFRVVGFRPTTSSAEQYTWKYCQAVQASQAPPEYRPYFGEPCMISSQGGTKVINDGVKWATREGRQWNYKPQLTIGGCGCYYYNLSSDPSGRTMSISAFTNSAEPEVLVFTDNRRGKSYSFAQSDTNPLLIEGVSGEASTSYKYDSRNNVVELRRTALAGSGDSDLIVQASYPPTCSNPVTCNKPLAVVDANGNTSTADYDQVHGMPTLLSWPATAGVTKQRRISYVRRSAVYFQNDGNIRASSEGVWLPARESECRTSNWTGSTCAAGSMDEVVTEYDYGPSESISNLLLRGIVVSASGQSRRTCFTYDRMGNRISETKPRAGLSVCS